MSTMFRQLFLLLQLTGCSFLLSEAAAPLPRSIFSGRRHQHQHTQSLLLPLRRTAFLIQRGGNSDLPSNDPVKKKKQPPIQEDELESDLEDEEENEEDEEDLTTIDEEEEEEEPADDTPSVVQQEELLVDDPMIDEDSSANVDRMEYADAYDDEEEDVTDYTTASESGDSVAEVAAEDEAGGEVEDTAIADTAIADTTVTTTESVDETTMDDNEDKEESQDFTDALPTIMLSSVITEDMKQVLMRELKYRASDLKGMRADIASVLVAKKVQRPMEGLPPHWYEDSEKKAVSKTAGRPILRKIIISAVVVAMGIAAGSKLDLAGLGGAGIALPSFVKSSPKPSKPQQTPTQQDPYQGMFETLEDSTAEASVVEPTAASETADVTTSESSSVVHEHSVRPGENYPTEPIDETWLDKAITAVERRLKKLFGLK